MQNGTKFTNVFQDCLKSTIYLGKCIWEVGIPLILFHGIELFFTVYFFYYFESQALGKSPWKNGNDLLICHLPKLKIS